MRKLQVLGAALVALFVLGVLTASSASAVTFLLAEWLVGGVGTTTTQLVDTEGERLLEETVLGVKIDLVCSGVYDGSIGPNGADDTTELLTLTTGVLISKDLEEASGILCTNGSNCPEPLVWAVGLPWLTLAELMVDGTEEFFVDLVASTVAGNVIGYHIICMGSGLSDLCTFVEGLFKLTNEANGTVDSEFSESFVELAGLKLFSCEVAGNESGRVEGLEITLLTGGGSLAVSE